MLNIATTRILHAPALADAPRLPRPWVCPLPKLDGLTPRVLDPGEGTSQGSVEVGYPDRSSSTSFVPVFAAHDGVITYAGTAGGSATICLDHAGGWSTHYTDLGHLLVAPTDRFRHRRKTRIHAGDVLGHASRSSLRIRFGLMHLGESGWIVVDSTELIPTWSALPWFDEPTMPRTEQCGLRRRDERRHQASG